MKKAIAILIFGTMPLLALAGGDHPGGHGSHGGHDMSGLLHDNHTANAGRPGDLARVSRTIEVTMNDTMRFAPDQLKVEGGDTVRFIVRNAGNIQHEMVIGSMAELQGHAEMMRATPTMQHADPSMISLAPGQRGELIWQFDQPGSFEFACLVPGHLEAGMTGRVEVQ